MKDTLLKRQRRIKRLTFLNTLTDVLLHPLLIPFYFVYIIFTCYFRHLSLGNFKLIYTLSTLCLLVIVPLIIKFILVKAHKISPSIHLYNPRDKKLSLLAVLLPYCVALYLFNITIPSLFSRYASLLFFIALVLAILSFRNSHFDLHIIALTCLSVVCYDICRDSLTIFFLCCAIILTGIKTALLARLHRVDTQTILFSILFGTGASILILYLQLIP